MLATRVYEHVAIWYTPSKNKVHKVIQASIVFCMQAGEHVVEQQNISQVHAFEVTSSDGLVIVKCWSNAHKNGT